MKAVEYILLITIILPVFAFGGELPYSKTVKLTKEVETVTLPSYDNDSLVAEDKACENCGERFGIGIDVDINIDKDGTWEILEDGRKVWRLRFYSENAKELDLKLKSFILPEGAFLSFLDLNSGTVVSTYSGPVSNVSLLMFQPNM